MPLPAYVIFAESGSIDSHSNRVSAFDIIEQFDVSKRAEAVESDQPQPKRKDFKVYCAWLRSDNDKPSDKFESQIVCIDPDGTELMTSEVDTFQFTLSFHRYQLRNVAFPGFITLGLHFIEGRIRHAGKSEWEVIQRFPFLVKESAKQASK